MYAAIVSTATPPSLPSSSSKKGLAYRLRPIVCTGMTPPPLSVDACRWKDQRWKGGSGLEPGREAVKVSDWIQKNWRKETFWFFFFLFFLKICDWKREGRTGRLGIRRKLMTDQREGAGSNSYSLIKCSPVDTFEGKWVEMKATKKKRKKKHTYLRSGTGKRNLATYVKDVCVVPKVIMHKTCWITAIATEIEIMVVVERKLTQRDFFFSSVSAFNRRK